MSIYEQMARAFQIFAEYPGEQGVTYHHDEAYAGPDPEIVQPRAPDRTEAARLARQRRRRCLLLAQPRLRRAVAIGTNFFWHDRPRRFNRSHDQTVHVGKRSAGWSFGFRAWPHQLANENHIDWGYDTESPFGFPVMSRTDWRRVFTERRGWLVDEYGRREADPAAWLDALVRPDLKQRAWENSPAARGPYGGRRDGEHRDAEGFRFYAGEFS